MLAVDLFSGAGGLSRGLTQAGFNIACAVEIDTIATITFKNNIKSHVFNEDIRNVTGKQILSCLGIKKKELHLLAGCPPCQGFSALRDKNGTYNEKNELVFDFLRLVNATKPKMILVENVPGMIRGIGKNIFSNFKKDLENNYNIAVKIINAADYGIPQLRKRLVLHAIRKDIYKKMLAINPDFVFGFPTPTHCDPKFNTGDFQDWETVCVICDLPPLNAGETFEGEKIYNHTCLNMSELNKKRMAFIRNNTKSRDSLPDELKLKCHEDKKISFSDVYGIMDWGKPSPTITGGFLSFTKGRFGHPEQNRSISIREGARLQSFDDSFVFHGNKSQMALQIGNAVPPKLAEISGKYLYDILSQVEKTS